MLHTPSVCICEAWNKQTKNNRPDTLTKLPRSWYFPTLPIVCRPHVRRELTVSLKIDDIFVTRVSCCYLACYDHCGDGACYDDGDGFVSSEDGDGGKSFCNCGSRSGSCRPARAAARRLISCGDNCFSAPLSRACNRLRSSRSTLNRK